MKRKEFIKKGLLAGIAGAAAPFAVESANSTYNKLMKQVGFNHLPTQEYKTMNTVLHKANSRGHANHGWLNSHHSFSFASYYNPERMNFGVLRVLNDDTIDSGTGFGTHPHDNMEIISIPLEGALEHKDSMGNVAVIQEGDVQVMSAGTGIYHSEYNKYKDRKGKFLQIWLFPNKKNVKPRYDQISIRDVEKENELYQVLSPHTDDQGVWIHQNAWFHLGKFSKKKELTYDLKDKSNGVYAFLIGGTATIEGQPLEKRDGYGVWNTEKLKIETEAGTQLLLMEVPMKI